MGVREKLVELLNGVLSAEDVAASERITDHLIANGVTVQEWIPVSVPPEEPNEYIVMIKNAACATALFFDGDFWVEETVLVGAVHYAVTHWMPLPPAPEE